MIWNYDVITDKEKTSLITWGKFTSYTAAKVYKVVKISPAAILKGHNYNPVIWLHYPEQYHFAKWVFGFYSLVYYILSHLIVTRDTIAHEVWELFYFLTITCIISNKSINNLSFYQEILKYNWVSEHYWWQMVVIADVSIVRPASDGRLLPSSDKVVHYSL